jgi:uncharacterized protein (TIGR00369 family)
MRTPTKLNPEHITALMSIINKAPYFQLLNMKVVDIADARSIVEIHIDSAKHSNPFGGVHGGVIASLIDAAAYWATYSALSEESGLITADLSINYLATPKDNRLIAEGRRIKAGRTLCLSEATVKDGEGRLIAHGLSKQFVTEGIQTMAKAVAQVGAEPLPNKYY